tara:strand:+ start:60 stop:260 length:201 start_codon:yes stop_codon:yes gene_type:complete
MLEVITGANCLKDAGISTLMKLRTQLKGTIEKLDQEMGKRLMTTEELAKVSERNVTVQTSNTELTY